MDKNIYNPQSSAIYFSFGKLRFGHHGILATLALVATVIAYKSLDALSIHASVLLTTITALDARSLMPQVPKQSVIVPGVSAPHREAFSRTMSMMHYANGRILGHLYQWETTMVYQALLLYTWTRFVPIHSPLDNGNTIIFVVPIFLGVSLDIYQCLYLETSIDISHYLLLQLSALVIAFYFTLAFRGYFTVKQIYIASSLVVAGIFGGGMYLIVTSL
jgi:hypothetical protein